MVDASRHADEHVNSRRTGVAVLAALLAPVPFLMLAHWRHLELSPTFAGERWDVGIDRSYIEFLGYAELAVAACVLAVLAVRRGAPVYAGWSVALVVLLLDDSLEWHERAGVWLVETFPVPDPPGLRPQDVGELATWAVLGLAVGALLVVTHRRSSPTARRESWTISGIIVVLMAFAVVLDMFVIAVNTITSSAALLQGLNDLEAAGEVSAMAGLAAYAVHLGMRYR